MTSIQAAHRERITALKSMLEERRSEIHDKLRSIRQTMDDQSSVVRDTEEQSVNDFVHEMDLALLEMKAETLLRIDDALRRLAAGTYGACDECGREIPEARLKAMPFATLCRDDQEREEQRLAEERQGQPGRVDPSIV
jgi:DnaK suppressor protein